MPTSLIPFTGPRILDNPEAPIVGTVTGGAGDDTWVDASDGTYATTVQTYRSTLRTVSRAAAYIEPIAGIDTLTEMTVSGRFRADSTGTAGAPISVSVSFWTGLDDSTSQEILTGYSFDLQEADPGDWPPISLAAEDAIETKAGLQPDNFVGDLASSLLTARGFFAVGGWVTAERLANTGVGEGSPPVDYYLDTFELIITLTYTTGDEPVVRVLRLFPRHDAHGFGGVGRNYPRPSGRRNYGGQP